MLSSFYKEVWNLLFLYKVRFHYFGNNVHISPKSKIVNKRRIDIGDGVSIHDYSWILCSKDYSIKNKKSIIKIGANTNIGMYTIISGVKSIEIGRNVLFAPNVYISDHQHKFDDINKPILQQGIEKVRPVKIGDDCWLGINCCILPGVTIGRHVVIAANAVVNKNVPDYSVCAGNPAKVVKHFDFEKKIWVLDQ